MAEITVETMGMSMVELLDFAMVAQSVVLTVGH